MLCRLCLVAYIYSYSTDSFLYLFSVISLAFLPETTGKTSQEIEKFFEKERELNRIGNIKEDDL